MNIVSNNKVKKIFLCSNMKIYENSKVDIILSPEFYWVRIFNIPVKNVTQAKAVLPTLFDDILIKEENLSYQAIKLEDNKYLCFAYINKKIYEAIKNSGLHLSLVNSVYFAQNECKNYKQFTICDKSFFYTEDNILVKVPNELLTEKIELSAVVNSINLSSNKVDIKLYNNFLTTKQIYIVLIICSVISITNFTKYFVYKSEVSKQEDRITEIRTLNNLPTSSIQTDSMINQNKKIAQKEISKREIIAYILENSKIDLKTISVDNDVVGINVLNIDKKGIEDYISKKYKIVSSNVSGLNLNIKIQQ